MGSLPGLPSSTSPKAEFCMLSRGLPTCPVLGKPREGAHGCQPRFTLGTFALKMPNSPRHDGMSPRRLIPTTPTAGGPRARVLAQVFVMPHKVVNEALRSTSRLGGPSVPFFGMRDVESPSPCSHTLHLFREGGEQGKSKGSLCCDCSISVCSVFGRSRAVMEGNQKGRQRHRQ